MAEPGSQPLKRVSSIQNEKSIGVVVVQRLKPAAAFNQRCVRAVAAVPGGPRDADHVGVRRPLIDAREQRLVCGLVALQRQGERVGAPMH